MFKNNEKKKFWVLFAEARRDLKRKLRNFFFSLSLPHHPFFCVCVRKNFAGFAWRAKIEEKKKFCLPVRLKK